MKDATIQHFTIEIMQPADFMAANEVRLQSYLDAHVNDAAGITRDWVKMRNEMQRKPEIVAQRRQLMEESKSISWVAKDSSGDVIGVASPYVSAKGVQRVGSLYVEKNWRGMGVGSSLIKKIIEWQDPTQPIRLRVATYNERAKAFYKKHGFREIPGSEHIEAEKIPVIEMIRKGDKQ